MGASFPRNGSWHAALGRSYAASEIDIAVREQPSLAQDYVETPRAELRDVVGILTAGGVVGWFQGGSEFGPRALGNRSLIADPRRPEMKDILNSRVKHRQPFRPVRADRARRARRRDFDGHGNSPFMLIAKPVAPSGRIPAIVHVDGTARVQTVTEDDATRIVSLLKEFEALTGVPVLLNTSFNVKGEPIVETPRDAIASAVSA